MLSEPTAFLALVTPAPFALDPNFFIVAPVWLAVVLAVFTPGTLVAFCRTLSLLTERVPGAVATPSSVGGSLVLRASEMLLRIVPPTLELTVPAEGSVAVPTGPGLGTTLDDARLDEFAVRSRAFEPADR